MRALPGAIVVLAGALLWAAGAVCLTIAPVTHSPRDYGLYAALGGAFIAVLGLLIAFQGARADNADRPS